MRCTLRVLAVAVILTALVLWFRGGQNPGFTKTSKTTMLTDPVTELRYPQEQKGFYPGIDFLAAAALLSAAMLGGSFACKKKTSTP